MTVLQRCYQLPVRDTEQILLPQLLTALNSAYLDEVKAAVSAVFATYRDAQTIAQTIKSIIPNRRSLDIAIASLLNRLSWYGKDFLPIVKAILSVLAIDSLTVSLQIKLAVSSIPWEELSQFFISLNNRQELHADALTVATNAVLHSYHRLDISEIHNLETALAKSEAEKLRRLALSTLIPQTTSLGWDRAKVDRLISYRQDKSILVAAAAQFTFPPDKIVDDN